MAEDVLVGAHDRAARWAEATVTAMEAAVRAAEAGERAERAARVAAVVAHVAAEVARELDQGRVVSAVLDQAIDTLSARTATIHLADEEQCALHLAGYRNLPADLAERLARIPLDAPLMAARAASTRQIQVVEEAAALDPELEMAREVLARTNGNSIVSAPMIASGRLVGVLTYVAPEPHHFLPEELAAIRTITEFCAIDLINATAFETERHCRTRIEAVRQAALAVSEEIFLPIVLHTIVEQAQAVVGAAYAALGVADGHRLHPFEPWVYVGMSDEQAEAIGRRPCPRGILGAAADEARAIRLRDLRGDPRFAGFPPNHPEMTSFLAVPIVYHGCCIANLYFANKVGAEEFAEVDQQAAELLAQHAAIAIQHARLHEEMVSALSELNQAEGALRAREERFRLLAEHAQDLIYRYRLVPTPAFEYVSPSATAITGYTPEEHYADPDLGFKIVHPDDRPILAAIRQSPALLSGPVELRWVRKDGTLIWTEQRNVPICDEAGRLIAVEGIARDITTSKRAAAARARAIALRRPMRPRLMPGRARR